MPDTIPQDAVDKARALAVKGLMQGGMDQASAEQIADQAVALALQHGIDAADQGEVTKAGGEAAHPEATERLMRYWSEGEGAAKIRWGEKDDFYRCEAELGKYVQGHQLKGLCANLHHRALGVWPGQEDGGRQHSDKAIDTRSTLYALEDDARPKGLAKYSPYELRGPNGEWLRGAAEDHHELRKDSEKIQQQAQHKAERWFDSGLDKDAMDMGLGEVADDPRSFWHEYQNPDSYGTINAVLRGTHHIEGAPPRKELMGTVDKMFDEAGTTTTKPMTLWRAMRYDGGIDWSKKLKVGSTFHDKGMISTTAQGNLAEGWLGIDAQGNPDFHLEDGKPVLNIDPQDVVMEIHVPAGTRIVGGNPDFIETMLHPDSAFKVTANYLTESHPYDPLARGPMPSAKYTRVVVQMTKDGAAEADHAHAA